MITKVGDLPIEVQKILYEIEAFFRDLNRSGMRLDPEWPERDFDRVKTKLEDLLYPEVIDAVPNEER